MRTILTGSLSAIVLAVMAGTGAASAAGMPTEDMVMTDQGNLTIDPFHHASVMLTWNGMHILVDPAPPFGAKGDVTAEYTAAPAPDLILVTHEHRDHFNVDILEAVAGDDTPIVVPQSVADKMPADLKSHAKVMANGDTATVKGVPIRAVPAYNITEGRLKFHPKGRDNGYILTLGGKQAYIAGDSEDTPEMRALTGIDVAFLPMDGTYTMDTDHAAQAVKAFRPAIVYPYHYLQSDVEAFKAEVGDAADVRLLKWY